jgi:hypothetical protein
LVERAGEPPRIADPVAHGPPGGGKLVRQRVHVFPDGRAEQHRDQDDQGGDQQHGEGERPSGRERRGLSDDIRQGVKENRDQHGGKNEQQQIRELPGEQQDQDDSRYEQEPF